MRVLVPYLASALVVALTLSGSPDEKRKPTSPVPGSASCLVPEHVLLISIDGLRPEFYLDEGWPAPTLQRLAREGARAPGAQSVFPSVTYPSHTTMVTGLTPDGHGIVANASYGFHLPERTSYFWADSVRAPALWSLVRDEGGSTAGFWWPVAIDAEIDFNLPVPDVPGPDGPPRSELLRTVATPAGYFDTLEARVTGPLHPEQLENGTREKERHIGRMAAWTLQTERPTLTVHHIVSTDKAQHTHGREHLEVRAAVANADSVVADLLDGLEAAGIVQATTIVVTGDHGFADVTARLRPNVLLREAGLLERARFVAGGGSAVLVTASDEDEEAVELARRAILASPAAARERFEILDEEALRERGADPRVRLALSARPGTAFGDPSDGAVLDTDLPTTGAHGHDPRLPEMHTGFLAHGAGVGEGVVLPVVSLLDIAPFIADLLDLPFQNGWRSPRWLPEARCAATGTFPDAP